MTGYTSDKMDTDERQPTSSYSGGYKSVLGFRLGECIGGGGFSKVFRAIEETGTSYGRVAACKVVDLFISPEAGAGVPNQKELQKEVQVHKSLKHGYILEFMASELVERDSGYVPGLYMLLELAIGGDLFDKIAPEVGVPEDLAKFYFAQMVAGIEFVHSKGVCHRDLKPENLLLAANGNLKVSDFGLCAVFRHKGKTRLLSGRCGSLPYVAPELGAGGGYAAEPIDVWGIGCVLYTMLVGNTPWDEPSTNSPEFSAYLTGELLQYAPWDRITGQAREMILALLTVDPNQRITIEGIKNHRWMMTPSQIQRHNLGLELTKGIRENGMMAIAEPLYDSPAANAYAAARSQRVKTNTALQNHMSQMSQVESQFMRGTGTLSRTGELNVVTTRFWLQLSPTDSLTILHQILTAELGDDKVIVDRSQTNVASLRVSKLGGSQQLTGTIILQEDDRFAEGQTLVKMVRSQGPILHWRAFWWGLVRNKDLEQYVLRGDASDAQ